jgi:hypothetical protein
MQGEFIKGNIVDVCAELEAEAKRCKGMAVGKWLKLRALERIEKKQFEELFKSKREGR